MELNLKIPSPLQKLEDSRFETKKLQVYIKREDLIHPIISGNKWRKIKYNLEEFNNQSFQQIISFGGAHSNHLHALSYLCHYNKIPLIAFIRGEELNENSNPTLNDIKKWGTTLKFIDRTTYRKRYEATFLADIQREHPNSYIVPEGGNNALGIKGCEEIVSEINIPYNYIACPSGTGATALGIEKTISHDKQLLIFSSLKGDVTEKELRPLLTKSNTQILSNYHFGGFGKTKIELINFKENFETVKKISLDPVYTSKMFYGIYDLIKNDYFKPNSTIILIHTGGLQGNRV